MSLGLVLVVVLNIFTIFLVGLVFYVTFLAFEKRNNRNESWLSVFKRIWSSQESLEKSLRSPTYGNLGTFVGENISEQLPYVSIKKADKQDSLKEFMSQGKPNYVGIPPKS